MVEFWWFWVINTNILSSEDVLSPYTFFTLAAPSSDHNINEFLFYSYDNISNTIANTDCNPNHLEIHIN